MVSEIMGVTNEKSVYAAITTQPPVRAESSSSPAQKVEKPKASELELKLDLEVVQRAAATVSQFIETVSRDVRVAYDDSISRPIFTVLDAETSEVIRQIPSEDLVAIARFLEAQGVDSSSTEALAGVLISEQT